MKKPTDDPEYLRDLAFRRDDINSKRDLAFRRGHLQFYIDRDDGLLKPTSAENLQANPYNYRTNRLQWYWWRAGWYYAAGVEDFAEPNDGAEEAWAADYP
jgi:hypothetical protein